MYVKTYNSCQGELRGAITRNVGFTHSLRWPIYFINSVDKTKFKLDMSRLSVDISADTQPIYRPLKYRPTCRPTSVASRPLGIPSTVHRYTTTVNSTDTVTTVNSNVTVEVSAECRPTYRPSINRPIVATDDLPT